jgi:hypothetical protein
MQVTVKDSFDVKDRVALEYGASGVVAVFDLPDPADPPKQGKQMLVVRPDGWMIQSVMGEVQEHSRGGYIFFLKDLTKADVPVGARVYWGEAMREFLEGAARQVQVA